MSGVPVPRLTPDAEVRALAALELDSIARGVECLDALLKEAPVVAHIAQGSSDGKYLIVASGEVEEAAQAMGRAIEVGGDAIVDDVLLPAPHPQLVAALRAGSDPVERATPPAIAVIETRGAPTLLGSADTAVKTGETQIAAVHLLAGIGGKSTVVLTGDVESVRVASEAGADFARSRDLLVHEVVIPRPDPGVVPFLDPLFLEPDRLDRRPDLDRL